MLKQMWVNRHRYGFSTTNKFIKLAPGDVITVAGKVMRVIEMADRDGIIDFTCESEEGGVYTNTAVADDLALSVPDLTQDDYVPSFILLDIPALSGDAPSFGLTAAMYGNASYNGGTIQRSSDGGNTWVNVAFFNTVSAKVGTCTDTLGDGSTTVLDTVSTVTVDLSASVGTLSSGTNLCIIGSAANGWEILQFLTASLVSGNTYTLTNFYRGLYGTEGEVAGHGASETFILVTLGSGVGYVGANPADYGNTYLFRARNSNGIYGDSVSYVIGQKLSTVTLVITAGVNKAIADTPTLVVT